MLSGSHAGGKRALSPTIGVVLLGVTVLVLAASVGLYATGIVGSQQTTPETTWETKETTTERGVKITFTQTDGDAIDPGLLAVVVEDDAKPVDDGAEAGTSSFTIASFDSTEAYPADTAVELVFSPASGEERTTLATHELDGSTTGLLVTVELE